MSQRIALHVDQELAESLTDEYHAYASGTDAFQELDQTWVLERLQENFEADDLDYLIATDYGRALLMGQLVILYIQEQIREYEDERS